jgi:biotin operon repressor
MPYERVWETNRRFDELIRLLREECKHTRGLASALGVSAATVTRMLRELRRQGYAVRSVHDEKGWYYELAAIPSDRDDEQQDMGFTGVRRGRTSTAGDKRLLS